MAYQKMLHTTSTDFYRHLTSSLWRSYGMGGPYRAVAGARCPRVWIRAREKIKGLSESVVSHGTASSGVAERCRVVAVQGSPSIPQIRK